MGAEEVWLAAWASGGRSKEEEERKQNEGEETLRWIKLRSMGGCMSSKANVDTTIRSVGTPLGNVSLAHDFNIGYVARDIFSLALQDADTNSLASVLHCSLSSLLLLGRDLIYLREK